MVHMREARRDEGRTNDRHAKTLRCNGGGRELRPQSAREARSGLVVLGFQYHFQAHMACARLHSVDAVYVRSQVRRVLVWPYELRASQSDRVAY